MRRTPPALALLALVTACSPGPAPSPAAPEGPERPPDAAVWWMEATRHPSGRERILAPRELRALLDRGEAWGFEADADWWKECRRWAFERVLSLDPSDVEANEALGRRTLRGLVPDFAGLWERIQLARVRDEAGDALLDRYDDALLDGHPIFLLREEAEEALALLRRAEAHLERLETDVRYRAEQVALGRVRNSVLGDYRFVHRFVGPFLACFTARDLQRIPGEDPEAEDARLEAARALYLRRLDQRADVLSGLLDDVATLYPGGKERFAVGDEVVFVLWTFGDRAMFEDFAVRAQIDTRRNPPYRCGALHAQSGFAYLYEPPMGDAVGAEQERAAEARAERVLRESLAYFGALQLLHYWATDPDDPLIDHLERSRAFWLKEGWPSWLASRRVEESPVGQALAAMRAMAEASGAGDVLPRLEDVVARRSRLDPGPQLPSEEVYTDIVCALVARLHEEKYHAPFERYLRSQLEGGRRDIEWFEECFGIEGAGGWRSLRNAVFARGADNG